MTKASKTVCMLLAIAAFAIISIETFAQAPGCEQMDADHIFCHQYAPKQVSGGGAFYGPWYVLQSNPAPAGWRFQSAAFHLIGPHYCDGDESSTMQPPDPTGHWRGGNPDTLWMGHRNGDHHYHAVCFLYGEDTNDAVWKYNIQGEEGGCSATTYPWSGNNQWVKIDCRKDGAISEPARLDIVYAKIPPLPPAWPQAHKVVKGENLTMIAKATYGKEVWMKIYEANKAKIGDVDRIFPGEELTIPAP